MGRFGTSLKVGGLRVLIVGLNFAPETTSTGRYSGELADWLAHAGHLIKVISAPPYYPDWKIGDGHRRLYYRRENFGMALSKVAVIRCPIYVPARPNGVRRLLHLLSFAITSAPFALTARRWRPDVVILVAPTLFAVPATLAGARLAGCPVWLHVQDFEVGAAKSTGILTGAIALRLASCWEKWCLGRCDRVSTISGPMLGSLSNKGVAKTRQVLFPNWADIALVSPAGNGGEFRRELGLSSEQKVALYAGNMGEKQGLELVLEGAHCLSHDSDVVVVMAGNGAARRRLEAQSRGMRNVKWLPVQPNERLNDLLNLADVHLLPQRADVADMVMPSKLTNMLASGRPVVATAAKGMAIHDILAGSDAGVVVDPGDVNGLVAAVIRLMANAGERARMGMNGRAYAEKYLNKERILSQFEKDLYECVLEYQENRRTRRSRGAPGVVPPKD